MAKGEKTAFVGNWTGVICRRMPIEGNSTDRHPPPWLRNEPFLPSSRLRAILFTLSGLISRHRR